MRVLDLGRRPYLETEAAMRDFTAARGADAEDEIWLVEHDAVFTQGVAGREVHIHDAGPIPVIRTGRGGQVTHHGPGQVVAYVLVDLRRLGFYVREFVHRLEEAVIDALWSFGVVGHRVPGAPGIYVRLDDAAGHEVLRTDPLDPFAGLGKIAALGIKVSHHCTYHGVALNVAMDLAPFGRIDPCGYAGLKAVDLRSLGVQTSPSDAALALARALRHRLAPS